MSDASDSNISSQEASPVDTSPIIDQVNLTIEAFLGSTQIRVADLKDLTTDSVLELSASLNQAVELRVNEVVIGKGELVAVDDKFGVKITQLAK